jgi:hypothetical protein
VFLRCRKMPNPFRNNDLTADYILLMERLDPRRVVTPAELTSPLPTIRQSSQVEFIELSPIPNQAPPLKRADQHHVALWHFAPRSGSCGRVSILGCDSTIPRSETGCCSFAQQNEPLLHL